MNWLNWTCSQINPFGKLPAVIDSDVLLEDGSPLKLFESG